MRLLLRSAQEIRDLIAGSAEYKRIYETEKEKYEIWRGRFDDFEGTERVTGWAHEYVCPACSGRLIYDRDEPLLHICSQCGTVAPNTREVLDAWVYYTRSEIADSLVAASLVYYIYGDADAREYIIHAIDWYAEHYVDFPEHGKHAGQGRVMAQSLDEAVWGMKLLRALANIGFDTTSPRGQRWYRKLFQLAARLVLSQQFTIHNIPLWHASYAVSAALMFGDTRLFGSAMNQDLGARQQVLKGFTPDGIWYENSNGYHYYSLEAAGNMCVFLYQALNPVPEIYERVLQAILAPIDIAFRDGEMTAMNDASKGTNVFEKIGGMRWAAKALASVPGVDKLYALIARYGAAPDLDSLLYDVPALAAAEVKLDSSILLKHNRVAVLRSSEAEVFFKFGNLTRSHAHPDALAISFKDFSEDPACAGYASKLHREWYTKTLAHNTFIVGAASMNPLADGEAVMSGGGKELAAEVSGAYPNVRASRKLRLDGAALSDILTVEAEAGAVVDYVFHASGELGLDESAAAGEALLPWQLTLGKTGQGYEHLSNIRSFSGALKPRWTRGGKSLVLEAETDGAEVFIATSPDNPATLQRTTIIIRRHASPEGKAVFKAKFTFG